MVDPGSLAPPLRVLFEGQQAALEALRAEVAALSDRNRRLEHLLNELRRALHGQKSEKLHPDQFQLAFEELEGALAEAEEEAPASTARAPRPKRPAAQRNIGHLPAHLPRIVEVIEPESTLALCGEMVPSAKIARIAARHRSRAASGDRHRAAEVSCRACEEGVTQAPAPRPPDRGRPADRRAAGACPGVEVRGPPPLYRQSQILARSGIDLHRSTLADWVGKASFHLRPVVDCLAAELKRSGKLGMDETTVRVLEPGRGRTRTGYMWTMVRDERPWCGADPPGVVYRYAPGRGGKHGEKLLAGTLQTDGYSGYNRLRRSDRPDGALTLAACWAHARRGLKEMFDSNGSPIAKAGLERIARLYAIEEKIRGEPPATRQAIRWTESAPLVNAFGVWLDEQRSRVSPRSRLGEKLTYIANQWGGLLVFLYDGRVEIDSNFVENLIRPVKLTAKNALFAGHDEGAAAWGRIASLIGTCKMNGVEPYAWLTNTLEKIAAGHPQSRILELLPWNFEPASS